jgi:hypothetical protein
MKYEILDFDICWRLKLFCFLQSPDLLRLFSALLYGCRWFCTGSGETSGRFSFTQNCVAHNLADTNFVQIGDGSG